MKNFFKIIIFIFLFLSISYADEKKTKTINDHDLIIYSGMFDFSDDGKKSNLFGIQHQNETLMRNTFFGTLSPVSGIMITGDTASYAYTGVQAEYKFGNLNVTPSFTPGIYHQGDGKDLGHIVEFKSEVQLSIDLFENSQLGFSYNHISNASLGEKNPGANSYMMNFFKQF